MSQEAFANLATLDALGLLAEEESACYRRLLAVAGPEAVAEADELREAATILAGNLEPVAPPPSVKAKIMGVIRPHAPLDETIPSNSRTVRKGEGKWYRQPVDGIDVMPLSVDKERGLATILMRLQPGAVYPPHDHHGAEECYVLSGTVRIGSVMLSAGDFHHAERDSHHGSVTSDSGCTLLLVVDEADYLVA